MDLWQLHIFVKVVEEKSFSKASAAIHLSQPTVSAHIKELEAHFKCKLLDRLGRTTEPTQAGILLYEHAKKLLSARDDAETAMFDFLGLTLGTLSIGASTIPADYLLPRIMGEYTRAHPGVSISVKAGDTEEILEDVARGQVEFGMVGALATDPAMAQALTQEEWMADQLKLILPSDHPWADKKQVDPGELSSQVFIGREKGSGTWNAILHSLEQAGFSPFHLSCPITMGNTNAVIQAILNKVGISILSPMAVDREIKSGDLVALDIQGLDLDRFFYLTLPRKRSLSPICQKFIKFVRRFPIP